jgi:hypothetical protein
MFSHLPVGLLQIAQMGRQPISPIEITNRRGVGNNFKVKLFVIAKQSVNQRMLSYESEQPVEWGERSTHSKALIGPEPRL